MALFEKKFCEICGEKARLLSRTAIEDGYICGDCRNKLSEFSDDFSNKTLDDIKEEMSFREENKKLFETFVETRAVGEHNEILVDEDHGWWVLADSNDYTDGNPDVFRCDEFIRTDVREDFRTIQDDSDRDPNFHRPPREVLENLYFDVYVKHPYVNVVSFNLLSEFAPTPRRIDEAYRSAHDIEDFFRRMRADAVTVKREVEPENKTPDSDQAIAEIMKFKKLLDAGVLTEEEFAAKKKQILGI